MDIVSFILGQKTGGGGDTIKRATVPTIAIAAPTITITAELQEAE